MLSVAAPQPDPHAPPATIPLPSIEAVPAELRGLRRWLLWKYVQRDGRWSKLPVRTDGRAASSTNPDDWTTLDRALEAARRLNCGVGIALGRLDDGSFLAGVDLDNVKGQDGEFQPLARSIIEQLDSYTESSVSGTGAHILLRCSGLPGSKRRRGPVEIYLEGRFFVFTGLALNNRNVEERTSQLAAVYREVFGDEETAPATTTATLPSMPSTAGSALTPDDLDVIARIRRSSSGPKFDALWQGSTDGYDSPSEADMALAGILVNYCGGGAQQMLRICLASNRHRPAKTDRPDYWPRTIAKACANYQKKGGGKMENATVIPAAEPENTPWPTLDEAALYGVAGDLVRAVEPATEADPVAILAHFLAGFGCMIGRHAHYVVGGDEHYCNMFCIVVGASSVGRKGSSWSVVRQILKRVDKKFVEDRVVAGLSSGEGLIHAVRDELRVPAKNKNAKKVDVDEEILDHGVEDKRLLLIETEYSSVLKVAAREGNVLSNVIRQAYDSGNLSTLTKNSPTKATGAHISLCGHITRTELLKYLTETEMCSGFGNRHLFFCARRSKLLPDGGRLDNSALEPVVDKLRRAYAFGLGCDELHRDDEAAELWRELYPALTDESRTGLYGELTSRDVAHALRLQVLFAVLDCSETIKAEHVLAAAAVVSYSDQSIRFLFGNRLGDAVADTIVNALKTAPNGLPVSDIHALFSKHQPAARIRAALNHLAEIGVARMEVESTGGRPVERWFWTGRLSSLSSLFS